MISFILGVSITLNIITVIGLIIYFSIKNKVAESFSNKVLNSLEDDEIVNKDAASDFMQNDKIDFSSMIRR